MKILNIAFIDDENITLRLLESVIDWGDLGFSIIGKATDGSEGLKLYEDKHPDVIICDIVMPVMDGMEFIKDIRQIDKNIKIIIMSAHDEFKYAQKAIEYGISAYLLKPIDENALINILNALKNEISNEKTEHTLHNRLRNALISNMVDNEETQLDYLRIVKKANEYGQQNFFKNDFSIESVSNYINFSKNYFCKIYKLTTGETYWEYITMIRIELAKDLLLKTQKTNFEISKDIGYDSESHFSRKFKEVVGLSPKYFRQYGK